MHIEKGISSSEGITIAPIYVLHQEKTFINRESISQKEIESCISSLDLAIEKTKNEICCIKESNFESSETKEILESYLELLNDEELYNDIVNCIKNKKVNLTTALFDVSAEYAADMAALDDPYMQARADDFRQLFRMISEADSGSDKQYKSFEGDFILVANELGAADLAKVNKEFLKGVVVQTGSRTSHVAIVCRSMGIPMVSGVSEKLFEMKDNTPLIVDGYEGFVIAEPDDYKLALYQEKVNKTKEARREYEQYRDSVLYTAEGKKIELLANIGTLEELDSVLESNADGIGLFRTEFLFMERKNLPDENTQFEIYKCVLQKLKGKPVTFRTLDAGGDKNISALGIPREDNPFLGWRAIRYCLKTPEVFRIQLRAIIRAAKYGNCRIMIPMITSEHEVLQTKKLLDTVYEELEEREGVKYKKIPFGIMIETPAAALIAEDLAKQVDFFSLGTNDLTQYTVAVDRGNEYIVDLYDESHPAVLKLIKYSIDAALQNEINIHMCGEMAGDTKFTKSLLEMGLTEFSMSPSRIFPMRKHIVCSCMGK